MPGAKRIILTIENSNPSAVDASRPASSVSTGIAIGRCDSGTPDAPPQVEVLAVEEIRQLGREADDLLPAIQRAVASAELVPRDLTHVAVSIGPGGYTAVRMACAAGVMIARAVGAACIAVPSAWVVAAAALEPLAGARFAVALAGKDDSAHLTLFDSPQALRDIPVVAQDLGVLRAADLAALQLRAILADRFLPASIQAAAESIGIQVVPRRIDPVMCLHVAAQLDGKPPQSLAPLYPREPDAVTLWRARKP